jgi:hypothetical protein
MLNLLAQTTPPATESVAEPAKQSMFEVLTQIFANGDALANPDNLVTALSSMSIVWSVVFLVVGLLCLFNGYRYYKAMTVTLALLIGACVGYALGKKIGAQWIVAGCTGALLATICFPLMKYAVAVLGGLTGAYLGANMWSAIARLTTGDGAEQIAQNYWVGALLGLVLFGMLAFVLFKLTIIIFTSVSGSTITVLGVIALLLQIPLFQTQVAEGLKAHAAIIPMLVLVPAVIGLILQETMPDVHKVDAKPA